jgi:lysozyme family protein
MTDNFPASLAFVLRHECAYVPGHDGDLAFVVSENVPGDTGGCTKFGIDAADHPGLDIPNLTLDEAAAIYRDGEWTQCLCDDLPLGSDTAVFDCAVNNGVYISGLLLQRAIGACGYSITVDGQIGPVTLGLASTASQAAKWGLIDHMLELRRQHYADIVLLHPCDAQFLHGWLNRVNDLEQFLEPSQPQCAPAAISA